MLTELKSGSRAVGAKQSRRAISSGKALRVYLAGDADPMITDPLRTLSLQYGVPVAEVPTMRALGNACGISVGAAVAVLLQS